MQLDFKMLYIIIKDVMCVIERAEFNATAAKAQEN